MIGFIWDMKKLSNRPLKIASTLLLIAGIGISS